jgi:hypothetical protein
VLDLFSEACFCFDVLRCSVGVEHDSKLGAHSAGWEIPGELSADKAGVSVVSDDFAPHSLVVGTFHCVLGFEDVGNALSVVESSGSAIVDVLDLENGLVLLLGALTTFEVQKDCFLVESGRMVKT